MSVITKCGDDCTYCPRFVAEPDGRPATLGEVRELWTRLGLRVSGLPANEMACRGCLPQNDCAYLGLRACVTSRGYENCGPCTEYPCTLTTAVFAKTLDLEARAKRVCSAKELELLRKAFFSKKAHLDRTHPTGRGVPSREGAEV
ncbi:DUF3795 domain-containing protein [Candidatus Bipolaricaulota bacterium]|nr:DUF3795 domain-containing protein [Candidatus Bipolaricaulota bacterium]